MSSCNQKPTQNADSKEKNPDSLATSGTPNTSNNTDKNTPAAAPKIVQALGFEKSPTLIYGSNPSYLKIEKSDEGWDCKFVEDTSLEDPGMIDLSFKLQPKTGIEFTDFPDSNQYGLYFGKIPTKTKITICGTNSCSIVNQQELVVIKTSPDQFEKLYSAAKEFKANEIATTAWNLYFFDSNLKSFQNNQPAKLTLDKETTLDWNGVLDHTGTGPLITEEKALIDLRWFQTEKPILVGKYTDDGKEYRVIGIQQFTIDLTK